MHEVLCNEAIDVLKALRDSDTDFSVGEVQLYLTDEDGMIMELCIGVDDDGDLRKTMSHYNDMEELQFSHESNDEEDQGLLN